MRTVLLWVVVIAMVGCKRAAPPPGATATTAAVAVDAAPPAIDAAPPAPCAGQWAHVDPAFCTTATGPVGVGTSRCRIRWTVSASVSPRNRPRPVSALHSTAPAAN